jgi:hypothetical protein
LVAGLEIKREGCGIPHLAKNERDIHGRPGQVGHPGVCGRESGSFDSLVKRL